MNLECTAYIKGKKCTATKDLTNIVIHTQPGTLLRTPEQLCVKLCPKHFELDIPAPPTPPAQEV